MDPPLVNESSFSAANPSAYSLAEIWTFGRASDGVLGIRTGNLGRNLGGLAEGSGNRDGSAEESTVTEQSWGGGKRKRVDVSSEDESSKMVSTSSATNLIGMEQNDSSGKRMKLKESRDENGGAKAEETSSANGNEPGKPISKTLEPPKDYIHVRARRGQATDSHSLAERARREKISEKMKILQDLVPGCNKVIGKALVLDEIINYIQSLQHQVEFLSMKIEAVNSRINRNPGIEGYTTKDVNGTQAFDAAGMIYGCQAIPREYGQGQGLQPEWLHMQIGGAGFERAN